ncbi:MAG TPA: universal stress protein, partial [Allocoleopsis sp.]
MGFKKILVAIDYSPLSEAVFNQALELAKSDRSHLLLFHCLTADTVTLAPPFGGELGFSAHLVNQTYQTEVVRLDQQVQHIQALLHHYREQAKQAGVIAECDYRTVEPGQGLCQAAMRWSADLLVVGRRGRKGWTEALLG